MDFDFAGACVCQNIIATLDCFQRSPGVAAKRLGGVENPPCFPAAQLYLCPDPLSLEPASLRTSPGATAAVSYSNSAEKHSWNILRSDVTVVLSCLLPCSHRFLSSGKWPSVYLCLPVPLCSFLSLPAGRLAKSGTWVLFVSPLEATK